MLTEKNLIKAGYRKLLKADAPSLPERCVALYQKKVLTPEGATAYFINVYEYSRQVFQTIGLPDDVVDVNRFTVKVHLYTRDDTVEVSLHHTPEHTPKSVELFFAKMYLNLGCVPDWYNQ